MGKKVNKDTTISKNKQIKKEEVKEVPEVKATKNVQNKNKKEEKIEKVIKHEKVEKNDKKNKKGKEIANIEKAGEVADIKDEKVMNDTEEAATLEDINKKYETVLQEVKEKLGKNFDENLISKAIKCLKKIVLQKYKDSLNILSNEQEEFLYLNFVLGKLPFKYSMRPSAVSVPHSLFGEKFNTRVCLIVKDPSSDFKDLNIHANLPFKLKVIDINKLKLKFSRFAERRSLLKEYEMFFCDHKIYMLLKKHLGKPFYSTKKYPTPIRLDYTKPEEIKKNIINHVQKSSAFYMTHGPNYSVKIARAVSSNEEIMDNLKEAVYQTLSHILKWGASFEE